MSDNTDIIPLADGYEDFLNSLKERIRKSQVRAALAVNQELVMLYWEIGQDIMLRQKEQGWGAKTIKRLAGDLRRAFPDMKGFSERNLQYMRTFAEAWPDKAIAQQLAAQIPWFHNCMLLDKVRSADERSWYIQQTIENGWSRDIMVHQIERGLYRRMGQADTNFEQRLPAPQSDLARQLLKDPYNFDFLSLSKEAQERDLERGLVEHIREFLLELGAGFAFVGSQYHLQVSNRDFYLDLLFYHLKLRCYVVIDLKVADFEPDFAGKMNFYLSAVDDQMRHPDDKPSIGIILCKTKDKTIVEYALRNTTTPIGVSAYQLTEVLPDQLKESMPTIEALEAELKAASDEDGEA
ncbi:MAG TPA: PDDEXK nuclease domain-containing protein [Chloroflexia bacterium]|nr:PDDEXK nuclease domain-containing protein [Chloroflexia bacterium]